MRRTVLLKVAVALWGAFCAMAPAVDGQSAYPPPRDPYVNDFADRLSAADQERIRQLLSQARRQTGIAGTVVLIDSIHDYGTGAGGLESFATGLFNAWGVGSADRDDGVLILVALADREVRIELGAGYTARDSQRMQSVVDQYLVPRFRAGDIGGGLFEGARAALAMLADPSPPTVESGVPPAVEGVVREAAPEVTQSTVPPSRKRLGIHRNWFLVGGLTMLLLAALAARQIARRRRKCPDCGLAMLRLDEASDDSFLTPEQQTEEAVRSVDYDVWRCERCEITQVVPWRNWFSSFKVCPGCGARTLSTESYTLIAATYSACGQENIVRDCAGCSFKDSRIISLTRLTRSDSSVSGRSARRSYSGSSSRSSGFSSGRRSFGGGSSSGRGASGKW